MSFISFRKKKKFDIPEIKKPIDPFRDAAKLAGRKNILVNEWGPYNFQYPIIWSTNPVDTGNVLKFDVKALAGSWKIVSAKGVELLSKKAGSFPDSFTAVKTAGSRTDIEIIAEYKGPAFKDQFGNEIAAGKPYRFSLNKFSPKG